MPIKFPCPHCQGEVKCPDGSEGRHGKCPLCGKPIVIPGGTAITDQHSGPMPVVVVDFGMPFGSMVGFMVRWAFAAIPATIILIVTFKVAIYLIGSMLAATSMR